jgi:hypothetical protein
MGMQRSVGAMLLNLVHAVLQVAFGWYGASPARLRDGVR